MKGSFGGERAKDIGDHGEREQCYRQMNESRVHLFQT
jgi:hypothetical protein